jgi:TRAP-type C4-dicarboxylate transport system substrate-binding protein
MMRLQKMFCALASFFVFVAAARAEEAKYVIRMATAAPDGTLWARELKAFTNDVQQATHGEVRVKLYFGGIAGNELETEARMQRGQLDAVASGGMLCQQLSRSFRVMRIPGLFQSQEEAAAVLQRMRPIFDEEFHQKGYAHLGFAYMGTDVMFTRNPIRGLEDLKRARLWRWDLDEVAIAIDRAQGVPVVPLPVEDAARAYDDKQLDGFIAVPIAALAFQWYSRVKYQLPMPVGHLFGCLLVAGRAMDKVPLEYRQVLQAATAKLAARVADAGKVQDAQLINELFPKQGVTSLPVTDKLRDEFMKAYAAALERAGDKAVSHEALLKAREEQTRFRAEHKGKGGTP